MRQDRNPKPRPAGFRNNLNLRQDMGRPVPPQTQSRYPQQSRPPQRAPQPKARHAPRPMPVAKTPDRWKERRQMLKAAAWRLGKIVHKAPSAIIAAENPAELIRVPDARARQLAKKIVRLKKTRTKPPAK
jgi:hypothetical protein